MPGSLSKEAERKIIEEEGMSVEDYRKTIGKLKQSHLDMKTLRTISLLVNDDPSLVEDVKAIEIQKKLELENEKAQEQTAMRKTYIRWAIIYDNVAASRRYMEVEIDEGANANFLTHGMAADRRFQVQSLGSSPFRGETINGDVVCYEYAKVVLYGGNHDEHRHVEADFYILPADSPPNDPRIDKPIVGRHLLQQAGHLLLTENPRDPVWSTKMGKENEYLKEQSKQEAAKVEAYQANISRNRDASRGHKDDRDKKSQDRTSSSRKDEQGH